MEEWRIKQAREEIAKYPKLRAALAVAEIGHECHEMKLPDHMAKQGVKLSFLDHHILEMYLIARAVGLNPEDKYDKLKLACILLHDVVEDSDKQKARGIPDADLIDTREKLAKVLADKLSSYGYDEIKARKFANRVSEITSEDTNLDLLFESKRTTQVVRARSGMSDFAKLIKQLDVAHHMITAITLPPGIWSKEKRIATVFKGYEVGRSCTTGIEQLDNLIEMLCNEAYDSIIKNAEVKGDESFDIFALLEQAKNYKRSRNNTDHHVSSRPLFLNRVIKHGIKGIYLNDKMQVCSYASVVNPDSNFMERANDNAEHTRNEFEKRFGLKQPILTGDLVYDDSQYFRVMHLDSPMSISEFLDVVTKVDGAVCDELKGKLQAVEEALAKGNLSYIGGENRSNQHQQSNISTPIVQHKTEVPWMPLASITLLLSSLAYFNKNNKQKKQLEEASVKQPSLSAFSVPLK